VSVSPRVVLAAPLYNHGNYLGAAIDSILAQTYRDFALLLVDDGSVDNTSELCRAYAARDERICYLRNTTRLGLLGNTRRTLKLSSERYPEAEYYALGSDHDVWHPLWMERLVTALDADRSAVLAVPLTDRIDASGAIVRAARHFTVSTSEDSRTRFRETYEHMRAGEMIYGLVRVRALERVGSYRSVLVPDRLMLCELALQGRFVHVPEVLWSRRFVGLASLDRQRRALFPHGAPFYTRAPWWMTHTCALLGAYAVRRTEPISRATGARVAADYLRISIRHRRRRAVHRRRRERVRRGRMSMPAKPMCMTILSTLTFAVRRFSSVVSIARWFRVFVHPRHGQSEVGGIAAGKGRSPRRASRSATHAHQDKLGQAP
jgi:glycosyltransferase involved in cell wall biosynthesis